MIGEGQKIDGWTIVDIDYPIGKETWVHPRDWKMVSLMDPEDELVILVVPPQDQTLERIRALLQEELAKRAQWLDKEIPL